MKRLKTLLWVEYRRSRVWAAALLGSIVFWWWGLLQVRSLELINQLEIRAILLLIAASVGAAVLVLMIGRIRSETKDGTHQVLLMTPASGYAHVVARFGFTVSVAIAYYIGLMLMAWWAIGQAGIPLVAGDALALTLGMPLYAIATFLAPVLAWTVLLMVYISAHRVSGPNWIPGTVMVLATPLVFEKIGTGIYRILYRLPGWHVFEQLQLTLSGQYPDDSMGPALIMPQEPVWIMLLVCGVMLALAGRIWQEVEG